MGADEVVAIDIDKDSVATTHEVLSEMALAARFRTECISVFDLDPQRLGGPFDVVYSWGVLHHTGNMKQAIAKAGDMVATGGLFVLALYRRTWMCPLWRLEKRWYTQASRRMQGGARWVYEKLFRLSGGLSFDVDSYIRDYPVHRGMDFAHDVHDWLGGYPYESVLPVEVDRLLTTLGFQLQSSFLCKPTPGKLHGFMGTGCDEYVYSRVSG
jgi:2-polyprenyl-6-hydroxyphenyl methylase/3-demethylubiquinone-9 3-methyltransferase